MFLESDREQHWHMLFRSLRRGVATFLPGSPCSWYRSYFAWRRRRCEYNWSWGETKKREASWGKIRLWEVKQNARRHIEDTFCLIKRAINYFHPCRPTPERSSVFFPPCTARVSDLFPLRKPLPVFISGCNLLPTLNMLPRRAYTQRVFFFSFCFIPRNLLNTRHFVPFDIFIMTDTSSKRCYRVPKGLIIR